MSTFSKLPNELIIEIWGYVIEPEDVESFALVSKRVYGLATPFVEEHTRLKQEYSEICCPNGETRTRAADLLERMLLNPRITLYINELRIKTWENCWSHENNPLMSYSGDTMDLFKEAMRASSIIEPSKMGRWIADIELGDEDPILALMIMRLTKLKKFKLLRFFSEDDRHLREIFGRITQPSEAAICPRLPTWNLDRSLFVSAGLESLEAVATLPSVKEPEVWHPVSTGSGIENNSHVDTTRPSVFSNVSDLVMYFWDIEFDELCRLLWSMREVKSFSYFGSISSPIEPSQVCNELLDCSQHSLQKLFLRTDSEDDAGKSYSHMGDITRFSILAELETDFVLLLGSKNNTCRRLADILPTSIERVTLFSTLRNIIALEKLMEVVLQMVQSKKNSLPNLQELTFDFSQFHESCNTELITELEEMSAEVGVHFRATASFCA